MGILDGLARRVDDASYTGKARRAYEDGQRIFRVDLPYAVARGWIERIEASGEWVVDQTHDTTKPGGSYGGAVRVLDTTFVRVDPPLGAQRASQPPEAGNEAWRSVLPAQVGAIGADGVAHWRQFLDQRATECPLVGDRTSMSVDSRYVEVIKGIVEQHGVFACEGFEITAAAPHASPQVRLDLHRVRPAPPTAAGETEPAVDPAEIDRWLYELLKMEDACPAQGDTATLSADELTSFMLEAMLEGHGIFEVAERRPFNAPDGTRHVELVVTRTAPSRRYNTGPHAVAAARPAQTCHLPLEEVRSWIGRVDSLADNSGGDEFVLDCSGYAAMFVAGLAAHGRNVETAVTFYTPPNSADVIGRVVVREAAPGAADTQAVVTTPDTPDTAGDARTSQTVAADGADRTDGEGAQQTVAPAGWYADPGGKHERRYFDGRAWTNHVMDGDTRSVE